MTVCVFCLCGVCVCVCFGGSSKMTALGYVCVSFGLAAVRLPNSDNSYYAPSTRAPPLLQLFFLRLCFTDGVPTKARLLGPESAPCLYLITNLTSSSFCAFMIIHFSCLSISFCWSAGMFVQKIEPRLYQGQYCVHKVCFLNMSDQRLICSHFFFWNVKKNAATIWPDWSGPL